MLNVGVGLAAGRVKSIFPGKLSSRRDAEHQASAQRFKGKPCIPGRWLAKTNQRCQQPRQAQAVSRFYS